MDRAMIIGTLASARETLLRECNQEVVWADVQSIDEAMNELSKTDPKEIEIINGVLGMCQPYIRAVGRMEGMLDLVKARHPELKKKYKPVSVPVEKITAMGHDFWMMCNLLENNYEDHKSKQFSSSPSEGGGSGHVQPGDVGLQRDPASETTPDGGPGVPDNGRAY